MEKRRLVRDEVMTRHHEDRTVNTNKQGGFTVKNLSRGMKHLLDQSGRLPHYVWPGGYPLFYLDADGLVLCPDCANNNDEFTAPIVAYDANYEDTGLYCDHCGERIKSAYGEED